MRRLWRFTWRTLAALGAALILYCLVPVRPTIAPLRSRPGTAFWTMAGGHRIAYLKVPAPGGASAPPIVFLHGGPGGYVHSSIVATLAPLAAAGHDLYFYDQAGSGLSDRLARPKDYSFLAHVADLDQILREELGAPQVILIGHSYGGMLAAEYVALHPERVERLVLSSPGELPPALFDREGRWLNESKYPVPPDLRFVAPRSVATDGLRFWGPRALAAMALATAFDVKLMGDAEADGVLNTLAARFTVGMVCDPANVLPEEGGAGFYAHGWSNWFGDLEDPRPLLAERRLPVLVLQGECDYIPYAATYEYVDLLPNARYVFVAGAGHLLWWDRPARYRREIAEFLVQPRADGAMAASDD